MTTVGAARLPAAPARSVQGLPAGVVTRCSAATIDVLVAAAVTVVGYLLISGVLFLWRPAAFQFPSLGRNVALGCHVAVFVAYLAAAWSITGQTVGNELLGLRVRASRGGLIGPVRATARALLYAAFPIGLLFCVFGGRRASLQDFVLRTTVVYDWRRPTR